MAISIRKCGNLPTYLCFLWVYFLFLLPLFSISVQSMSESEPEPVGPNGGEVRLRLMRQNVKLSDLEKSLEQLRTAVIDLYAHKTAADMASGKPCSIQQISTVLFDTCNKYGMVRKLDFIT